MKLKALIFSLLVMISTSSFAQWFPGQVQVTVLPGYVSAQVFNPYYRPIVCSGQIFGQTAYGPVYSTYFVEQIMGVLEYRYAQVQTTPYAPFINGWTNINCRFAF
jgi:hypothetical protein